MGLYLILYLQAANVHVRIFETRQKDCMLSEEKKLNAIIFHLYELVLRSRQEKHKGSCVKLYAHLEEHQILQSECIHT